MAKHHSENTVKMQEILLTQTRLVVKYPTIFKVRFRMEESDIPSYVVNQISRASNIMGQKPHPLSIER